MNIPTIFLLILTHILCGNDMNQSKFEISLYYGLRVPKMAPPEAKKWFFWAQKNFWKLFSESLSQNLMFDTKTNFLSFVDPKLWPFKKYWYPKIAKFWNAHNTPPRGPRAKKFWISKFLPRGYLHAKNDQNRWDKGVNLLWSALEWANCQSWLSSWSLGRLVG
jgi:hypothetical protein